MRGQPRVRRRRAARPDQLPELRQSREAARRLAADRGGGGPGAGVRGARRPGRRRQRLAVQRGAERPDLPDAGGRHRRPAARCRAGRAARASRAMATRSRSSATFEPSPAGLRARRSCGASRRDWAAPPTWTLACRARGSCGGARRSPLGRAPQRARHRRGRARGGAGRVLRGRRDRRQVAVPAGIDLFGEAPGRAFIVSGSAERAVADMRIIGRVGGESSCEIAGALNARSFRAEPMPGTAGSVIWSSPAASLD